LKPGVVVDLDAVAGVSLLPPSVPHIEERILDCLAALWTTTRPFHSVRSYIISFPG
jgi:hypothetical protein